MNKKIRGFCLSTATLAMALLSGPASADGQLVNLQAVESGARYEGFIIKFREGTAAHAETGAVGSSLQGVMARLKQSGAVDASARANPLRPLDLKHVRRMFHGASVVRPSRRLGTAEAVAIMRQLAALPEVEFVEPDVIVTPVYEPNDSLYSQQWGFHDADAGIRAPAAWNVANGTGVIVGILDTGITSHPDLDANRFGGYDFIADLATANDGNGRDTDPSDPGDWNTGQCGRPAANSSWHGTHVAGTVAAVTNNANGVAGTAFGARFMPVRVLGVCGGPISDIADAITWVSGGSVNGVPPLVNSAVARVINMSFGAPGACPSSVQAAVNGAVSRGTTVIAAAGNSSIDVSGFQPANCIGVIPVAAVDVNSAKATFSNYGARIAVSAPGVDVLSTLNTGVTTPGVATYASYSGTSMAAPHVAGVVALAQSRRLALGKPIRTPAEMEILLKQTAYPLTGSCVGGCGAGIVDAQAVVDNAGSNATKINTHTDASGKITISVFERISPVANGTFTDFVVEVPEDYVVIGGGAEGARLPAGQLLTASYPNADMSAWVVSNKDHSVSNPAPIKAWAIGLKISGLTRQQVRDNLSVNVASSLNVQYPDVAVTVPAGYVMLGGGFKVNWTGGGNLAWASYPVGISQWRAASKDHSVVSPATLQVYSIGLRNVIPGVGRVLANEVSVPSAYAAHPEASAFLDAGYALTGCGALVTWSGAGNLLWKIKPVNPGSRHGCEVGSKDHSVSSPATVRSYVLGITVQ